MGMHVAIHFHPLKLGHSFYAYLQGLGIKDKESDILTIKGKIDSLTIDANADADAVLETFNINPCITLSTSTEGVGERASERGLGRDHGQRRQRTAPSHMVARGG